MYFWNLHTVPTYSLPSRPWIHPIILCTYYFIPSYVWLVPKSNSLLFAYPVYLDFVYPNGTIISYPFPMAGQPILLLESKQKKKANWVPSIQTLSPPYQENRVVRRQKKGNLAPWVLSTLCAGSLIVLRGIVWILLSLLLLLPRHVYSIETTGILQLINSKGHFPTEAQKYIIA
jgi:hypothetical protein